MRNGILYPHDQVGPMAARGLGAQCSVSRRWAHRNAWAYLLCVFTVAECHAQGTSTQRPSRDGAGEAKPTNEIVVKVQGPDGKPLAGALAFNLSGPAGVGIST